MLFGLNAAEAEPPPRVAFEEHILPVSPAAPRELRLVEAFSGPTHHYKLPSPPITGGPTEQTFYFKPSDTYRGLRLDGLSYLEYRCTHYSAMGLEREILAEVPHHKILRYRPTAVPPSVYLVFMDLDEIREGYYGDYDPPENSQAWYDWNASGGLSGTVVRYAGFRIHTDAKKITAITAGTPLAYQPIGIDTTREIPPIYGDPVQHTLGLSNPYNESRVGFYPAGP